MDGACVSLAVGFRSAALRDAKWAAAHCEKPGFLQRLRDDAKIGKRDKFGIRVNRRHRELSSCKQRSYNLAAGKPLARRDDGLRQHVRADALAGKDRDIRVSIRFVVTPGKKLVTECSRNQIALIDP